MEKTELGDVLSYTPETYFTDDEVALVRSVFNGPGGARLLKVIRKAMIPTISDPDLPTEEFAKDMFMARVDFTQMQADESKATAMGMQLATKTIIGGLIYLKQIANIKEESSTEKANRLAKDSTK